MTMNLSLNLAILFYFIAFLLYALNGVSHKKILIHIGRLALIMGVLFNVLCLGLRWQSAERVPLTNIYESMVFFGIVIGCVYLFYDIIYKAEYVGIVAGLLCLLALGYASFSDKSIKPLIPALQSNWLTIHVVTTFIGYSGFAVSFAASIAYLIAKNNTQDIVAYKSVAFGFLFLSVGIITGAVWANKAWGSYWSWDPKETWALITWFIYAVYIHTRVRVGIKARTAAYLNILGFISVLFTYLGVSYLLSGLHSYA